MGHSNIDTVQGLYAAYMRGDREGLAMAFQPGIRWHNSGWDAYAGDLEGVPAVLGYLFADDHLEDHRLEMVDMLASDTRVAIIARTSGRRGATTLANDFVQVIRLEGGLVSEVWNYNWDQRRLAELMPAQR